MVRPVIAAFVSLLVMAVPVTGNAVEYWPGADYDPAIPTVSQVLGYSSGERITDVRDARRYFEALVDAAPERVRLFEFGHSWEGRPLFYVSISSAANTARLNEIKGNMQRLRDPRVTSAAVAEEIIADQPAVTWLAYGVHGNEISSTDAAMLTAHHLLASRGDERVNQILDETVVVIVPMQNPDGRARFVHHYESSRGLVPDPDRQSAEHNERWPGGRTNHYLFDLNRDWFIRTQPETRGHADAVLAWLPTAFVDLHEMGWDSTYYFAPEAVPYNPHLAADQRASLELFGRTNAHWFDHFGIDYFTREIFDAFYPGYGASWPAYFGSVAMTYEQASARGLVVRQYDGQLLSYAESVRNHFVTSLGTAETVAANRVKFLSEFYDYQISAIAEGGQGDLRAYVLPTQLDQAGADSLAVLLAEQGVEVMRADESFSACGERYEPGSYVINLDQPAKRLIRTLMDVETSMESEFVREQERRRAKKLRDEIYDVTAWSLPLMMNVQAEGCGRKVALEGELVDATARRSGEVQGGEASVAYLVPWGERTSARFLTAALRADLRLKSTSQAFVHGGRTYPSGTLIVEVADNVPDLHGLVEGLAASSGANPIAVNDSWVTQGPSFGSNKVVRHRAPKVAMAWDTPTSAYVAGNTRFVLERQFDYPVSVLATRSLARFDLSGYDVLILPETRGGGYAEVLGEPGTEMLSEWVENGGVLIGVGNAMRYLADPEVDLLAVRREEVFQDSETADPEPDEKEVEEVTIPGRHLDAEAYTAAVTPFAGEPDSVAGVLVRSLVDEDHWLGAGVSSELNVLVRGRDIYSPIRLDSGVNVARFAAADELLVSGYLWEENRLQLAWKPFVIAQPKGRGFVIGFTQDPNVRAYLDGLNVIFLNAVFRGAAHARPLP